MSMGSYTQVIVGGMLLVVAYFFGRYINNQEFWSKGLAAGTSLQQTVKLQSESAPVEAEVHAAAVHDPNSLQRSLRERILGERARRESGVGVDEPDPRQTVESAIQARTPDVASSSEEIVEPDFSMLETQLAQPEETRLPKPDIQLPPAKPLIAKHRPAPDVRNTVRGTVDRLPPRKAKFSIEYRQKPKLASPATPPEQKMATRRGVIEFPKVSGRLVPVSRARDREMQPLQPVNYVSYTTVFGDTLHGLSSRFFGTPEYYLEIYLANRQILENPSQVPVNTTIRIPVVAEMVCQ